MFSFHEWMVDQIYWDSFRISYLQSLLGVKWKQPPVFIPHSPTSRRFKSHAKMVEKIRSENHIEPTNVDDTHKDEYTRGVWFIHYLFVVGAALGTEIFFILFLPALDWVLCEAVARRMIILWLIIYFFGQLLKDILRLPRPMQPPAIRLEKHYIQEYGLPSTHAMCACSMPFYFWYLMTGGDSTSVLLYVAWTWCFVMTVSRVYMGVHSTIDLFFGIVFGVSIYKILIRYHNAIDNWMIFTEHGMVKIFCLGLFLVFVYWVVCVYYSDKDWTPTFGDTTIIIGVVTGGLIAMRVSYLFYEPEFISHIAAGDLLSNSILFVTSEHPVIAYTQISATTGNVIYPLIIDHLVSIFKYNIWFSLLSRLFVGYFTLVIVRMIVKYVGFTVLTTIIPKPKKGSKQYSLPVRKMYRYDIPVKFLTYGSLGFIAKLIPFTYYWLGI